MAKLARLQFPFTVSIGSICKNLVQITDKIRRQTRFNIVDDISYRFKMIGGFDDIIYFGGFKRCGDFVLAINFLNRFLCQPVTSHAIRGIGKIYLDVLLNAVLVVFSALVDDLFG